MIPHAAHPQTDRAPASALGMVLLFLALAACGGDAGGDAAVVDGDIQTAETVGIDADLAPDRMPPQLEDFPLPDDIVFVAPPRYEFGRLIVGLNTQTDEDEVAALFDAELERNGYAISNAIDGGVKQWQFVKDGRQGVVNLDQNRLATVITINLFVEGTP